VDQANAAVESTRAAAVDANATLVADDAQVQAQRAAISAIVTSVYQGSGFLGLNALLTAGSPGEVLDRFGYANEIVGTQRQALGQFLAARMTAKDALNASNGAARTASAAQRTAAEALTRSRQTKADAATAQAAVTALIAQRKAALDVAQKNRAAALAQYQELQKEEKQVEAELAAQAAADKAAAARKAKTSKTPAPPTTSAGTVRSGYFIMPVHGWKSSNFGMRFDPIYRRWQLHAGVDIAVPTGTAIHAARAGRVIRAGRDGGYGNYTCIDTGLYAGAGADHGKDIANCYAHQSRILVHVGEHVRLGQTIGLVGATGAATGPHLHFEVRIDGTPVQPLNWLPKCFC
jgi:murein DD-endopeptidase MepM/ murein hydrolase activator NlpD